jgi:hypothetical protein
MDPTANLIEQIRLAESIIDQNDGSVDVVDACRLAELVIALRDWIAGDGAMPDWARAILVTGRRHAADCKCAGCRVERRHT